jgi:hypothetical protein
VYTVVILDKEFAETKLQKTITDYDIVEDVIIVHYDPEMLKVFLDTHQGTDYSASGKGGKKMKRNNNKRHTNNKRHNKKKKRTHKRRK